MKFNLRLGDGQNLTRENAWTCCTTNFAFPGSGSLLAGRKVGYLQSVLTLLGFILTMWFGVRFIAWGIRNWSELTSPSGDPLESFLNLWRASRGVVLGLGIFGFSWIWAFITSLTILSAARRNAETVAKPPVIKPPIIR